MVSLICFVIFIICIIVLYCLGRFGFEDSKVMNLFGSKNLLYLPYLLGYQVRLNKTFLNIPVGIYVFTGKQGSGKTLSLVRLAYQLKKNYSYDLYYSNMSLNGFDNYHNLEELTYLKRVICVADELGIVANSKLSKDINADLLRLTAQNRKNQRIILTTAQQFYQINKDIRTQSKYTIDCSKIGPLVINRYYIPSIDPDGNVKNGTFRKLDFFLVTKKLYNVYDTCEVIS